MAGNSVFIFTAGNSSCRKVMFSQACVRNFVHSWGGLCSPGMQWAGRVYSRIQWAVVSSKWVSTQGMSVHGWGSAWWRGCTPPRSRGRHPPDQEADPWPRFRHPQPRDRQPSPPPPSLLDDHWSGRYVFYWDTFLFWQFYSFYLVQKTSN